MRVRGRLYRESGVVLSLIPCAAGGSCSLAALAYEYVDDAGCEKYPLVSLFVDDIQNSELHELADQGIRAPVGDTQPQAGG